MLRYKSLFESLHMRMDVILKIFLVITFLRFVAEMKHAADFFVVLICISICPFHHAFLTYPDLVRVICHLL